jgi:hypothetical protein
LQFEAKGASSVAWNSAFDDMLCFSGSGTLSIRTSDFPLITQQIQGVAVGFRVRVATTATPCVPQLLRPPPNTTATSNVTAG